MIDEHALRIELHAFSMDGDEPHAQEWFAHLSPEELAFVQAEAARVIDSALLPMVERVAAALPSVHGAVETYRAWAASAREMPVAAAWSSLGPVARAFYGAMIAEYRARGSPNGDHHAGFALWLDEGLWKASENAQR